MHLHIVLFCILGFAAGIRIGIFDVKRKPWQRREQEGKEDGCLRHVYVPSVFLYLLQFAAIIPVTWYAAPYAQEPELWRCGGIAFTIFVTLGYLAWVWHRVQEVKYKQQCLEKRRLREEKRRQRRESLRQQQDEMTHKT